MKNKKIFTYITFLQWTLLFIISIFIVVLMVPESTDDTIIFVLIIGSMYALHVSIFKIFGKSVKHEIKENIESPLISEVDVGNILFTLKCGKCGATSNISVIKIIPLKDRNQNISQCSGPIYVDNLYSNSPGIEIDCDNCNTTATLNVIV